MFKIDRVAGSQRNVTFRVHGLVDSSQQLIEVKTEGLLSVKLSSLLWLVEEKGGFYLCWERGGPPLLPMESRNMVRFDQAIPSPEGWSGSLWLRAFKLAVGQSFFIVLDFDK